MLELCPRCGKMHYHTDACATKSTAALTEVHEASVDQQAGAPGNRRSGSSATHAAPSPLRRKSSEAAGTQAPPVDTMHPVEAMVAQGLIEAGNALLDVVRQRGRPRIHPDRKAYKAQKERERRAKAKQNA